MKYLALNAYFKLPEKFEGSFADGLRLMADAFDSQSKCDLSQCPASVAPLPNTTTFPAFEEVVKHGGVFCGSTAMQRLSDDKSQWIDIPYKVRNAPHGKNG